MSFNCGQCFSIGLIKMVYAAKLNATLCNVLEVRLDDGNYGTFRGCHRLHTADSSLANCIFRHRFRFIR